VSLWYERPMVSTADKPVRVLVVSGPARQRLYERFSRLYAGRDDVRVVLDRRERHRRGAPVSVAVERRCGDRRRTVPWLVFPPV